MFQKKSSQQDFIRRTLVFFKKRKFSCPKNDFSRLHATYVYYISRRSNKIIHMYFIKLALFLKVIYPKQYYKNSKKSGDYFWGADWAARAILKFSAILIKYLTLEGVFFFICIFMDKTNKKELLCILVSTLRSWLTQSWENFQFWLLCILFNVKIG